MKLWCFTTWAFMEDVNIILPCVSSFGFFGFKKENSCPFGVNIYDEPFNGEGAC